MPWLVPGAEATRRPTARTRSRTAPAGRRPSRRARQRQAPALPIARPGHGQVRQRAGLRRCRQAPKSRQPVGPEACLPAFCDGRTVPGEPPPMIREAPKSGPACIGRASVRSPACIGRVSVSVWDVFERMSPVYRSRTGGVLWGQVDDGSRVSVRHTLCPTPSGHHLAAKCPGRAGQGETWHILHHRCVGCENRAAQAVGRALASCILDWGIEVGDAREMEPARRLSGRGAPRNAHAAAAGSASSFRRNGCTRGRATASACAP